MGFTTTGKLTLPLSWIHSKIISSVTFRIIGLTKIAKIEFLPLDWIYGSIPIMTVYKVYGIWPQAWSYTHTSAQCTPTTDIHNQHEWGHAHTPTHTQTPTRSHTYACTHACTHILICTCACTCTHAHTHAHNYNIQLAKSTHCSCFLLLQLQCISSHYVLPLVLSDGWLVFALFPVVHLPS